MANAGMAVAWQWVSTKLLQKLLSQLSESKLEKAAYPMCALCSLPYSRGKSLLELWVTTFLPY